jgi:hypothetical protein
MVKSGIFAQDLTGPLTWDDAFGLDVVKAA